jgi:mono/diheme cytochrome c family protein
VLPFLVIWVLTLSAAGIAPRGIPDQKPPAGAPAPRDPAAAETYKKHCQVCHLDGNAPLEPLNFANRKWVHGSRLKDVITVIRDGVPGTAMIAFKDILTAEEIRAVAEHVRAFDKSLKPEKR